MSSEPENLDMRALDLFESSLDQPSDKRAQWICIQAGKDSKLAEKALKYLSHDNQSNVSFSTGGAFLDAIDDIIVPEKIGAYQISDIIGRGGMGAVFKGKRDSGDFDHDVAIKIVRPRALTDTLVERFQKERQTLANLAHPNIARLYDGGTLENGSPYIIMEYIEGDPITSWADDHELSLYKRLILFKAACNAVSHAHQNLIIHRDISPTNILVDQTGQVKLIDFGIAKPYGEDGTIIKEKDIADSNLSFTPGYAAPERMDGEGSNTVSDIYSLGRLLDDLTNNIEQNTELKAIIKKATHPNPDKRYTTVSTLDDDISQYLDGYPVSAIEPSTTYELKKFIGRNKASTSLAMFIFIGVIFSLIITLMLYDQAERARSQADARFNETRELTGFLLNDMGGGLRNLPGTLPLQQQVNEISLKYMDILAQAANENPSLAIEYANGRGQLADVLTDEGSRNLGDPSEGLKQIESGIKLLENFEMKAEISAEDKTAIKNTLADLYTSQSYLYRFYFDDLSKLKPSDDYARPIYNKLLEIEPGNMKAITNLLHLDLELWSLNTDQESSRLEIQNISKNIKSILDKSPEKYDSLINSSAFLYLVSDYAKRQWNFPYDIVPEKDRAIYEEIYDIVEYTFLIANQQLDEDPYNPANIYNYVWNLDALVNYSVMPKEWMPNIYNFETKIEDSILNTNLENILEHIRSHKDFEDGINKSDVLKGYLNKSDEILEQLNPYEADTFSYMETIYLTMLNRAYIEGALEFDLEKSMQYFEKALEIPDEYLKEEPKDDRVRSESIALRIQQAYVMTKLDILTGNDNKNAICKLLDDAIELDKKGIPVLKSNLYLKSGYADIRYIQELNQCNPLKTTK